MEMIIVLALSLTAVVVGSFALLLVALVVLPRIARSPRSLPSATPVPAVSTDSVIIADDYEREAHPERMPVMQTPPAMPAIVKPELVELGDNDSFEYLFGRTPSHSLPAVPDRGPRKIDERLSRRLDNLMGTRPMAQLPIPVAPAGVEPIPELEPTEIMLNRPAWATEWH